MADSSPSPADSGDSSSTTSTGGFPGTDTGSDDGIPGANGAACNDPSECRSGNCFVVGPLGGVCSECDESADCEPKPGFGCNFGNPLTGTPAMCSGGEPEAGCEVSEDCLAGLYCTPIIEVPGILSASTCSECEPETNDGCTSPAICSPSYDIADIGGYYSCVDPGSVPDASGCNVDGDGTECASGQCAPAALMGIPLVAVCSPCNEDGDCGGGMTCVLPEVVIEGDALVLVPGACV